MKLRSTGIAKTPLVLSVLMAILLLAPLSRTCADESGTGSDAALVARIDALLADKTLQTGFQGLLIQSLTDHSTLYARNADRVFMPASNNKLLTSGAALSLLGPDFVYTTRVTATAPPDRKGVVHSDLSVVGAGDPVLTSTDLSDLAHALKTSGVTTIEGVVTADDSLFDTQRLGSGWTSDDEPYYYAAQFSALNVNENLAAVHVLPGLREGEPVRIVITPTQNYMTVHNLARTAAAGTASTIDVRRVRGRNDLVITGTVALDTTAENAPKTAVTVDDPTQFALTVFRDALAREGIRVRGKRFPAASGSVSLAQHASVPLSGMLKLLNKPSNNLIAECLLKTVGAIKGGTGTAGSGGTGAETARSFFSSIGMDIDHLKQADGSGLSRYNFVSPRDFVQLLTYLHAQPNFPVFYDSLPIAGVDGTLRNRFLHTAAAENCHAKTGYISQASSLSGYITTKDREMLVFSILMNNHLTTNAAPVAIQDKIILLLAEYSRTGAVHAP